MIEMTISEVARNTARLKQLLESGEEVRIVFKQQKPNGAVELSALIKKEG